MELPGEESRVVLFVPLKVSDGKTWAHWRVERKGSTKMVRSEGIEGRTQEDKDAKWDRGEHKLRLGSSLWLCI